MTRPPSCPERETINGVEVHRVRTPRFGRDNLAGRLLDYLGFYVAASARLWRVARRGRHRRRQDGSAADLDPGRLGCTPARGAPRQLAAGPVSGGRDRPGRAGLDGCVGRMLIRLRNWSLRRPDMNVAIGELMREADLGRGNPGRTG